MSGVSVGIVVGEEGSQGRLTGREGLIGRQSAINRAPDCEPLERLDIVDADKTVEELGREFSVAEEAGRGLACWWAIDKESCATHNPAPWIGKLSRLTSFNTATLPSLSALCLTIPALRCSSLLARPIRA